MAQVTIESSGYIEIKKENAYETLQKMILYLSPGTAVTTNQETTIVGGIKDTKYGYMTIFVWDTGDLLEEGVQIQQVKLRMTIKTFSDNAKYQDWFMRNQTEFCPHEPPDVYDYSKLMYSPQILFQQSGTYFYPGEKEWVLDESVKYWIKKGTGNKTKIAFYIGKDSSPGSEWYSISGYEGMDTYIEFFTHLKGEGWGPKLIINYTGGEITAKRVFIRPEGCQKGDLFYHDGSKLVRLPAGQSGQVLKVGVNGVPEWGNS